MRIVQLLFSNINWFCLLCLFCFEKSEVLKVFALLIFVGFAFDFKITIISFSILNEKNKNIDGFHIKGIDCSQILSNWFSAGVGATEFVPIAIHDDVFVIIYCYALIVYD